MFKHCSLCEDKGFFFTKLIATRQLFREAEDDARITILAPQDTHLVVNTVIQIKTLSISVTKKTVLSPNYIANSDIWRQPPHRYDII